MNELTNALKIVNTSIKTVRLLDVIKKAVVFGAVAVCGMYVLKTVWK